MKAPLPGERKWTPRKVSQIVANRAYLGHAYYGEIENRDARPAIITRDEYDAAQVAGPGRNALKNEQGKLTGLIRYAGCRYVMRPRVEVRGDKKIPGYVCAKHHANGECPEPTVIAAHMIDEPVLLTGMFLSMPVDGDNDLDEARRVLTVAEDRMRDFLANDELRSIVGDGAYLSEARDRNSAVDAAQAAVDDLLRHRKPTAPQTSKHTTEDEIMDFHRSLLDSVYVRKGKGPVRERVLVFDRGDDKLDKPRRGNKTYPPKPVPWPEAPTDELYDKLLANWAKEPEIGVDGAQLA
jgi:hypothetical protein